MNNQYFKYITHTNYFRAMQVDSCVCLPPTLVGMATILARIKANQIGLVLL